MLGCWWVGLMYLNLPSNVVLYLETTLNFRFSCLYLSNAEITGLHHHAQIYGVPGIKTITPCALENILPTEPHTQISEVWYLEAVLMICDFLNQLWPECHVVLVPLRRASQLCLG